MIKLLVKDWVHFRALFNYFVKWSHLINNTLMKWKIM